MDRDYRLTTKKCKVVIHRTKGDNLKELNIEQARFRSSWYIISLAFITIIGYGWTLEFKLV